MKRSAAVKAASQQDSIADQLDRLVAERTAELAAANEQLRKELAQNRLSEAALRERELFDLIVESIPAPVAVTSPTGEVEALNQAILNYFGRTFEELKGWKSSDVVHPDDLERTIAAQMQALRTGSAYNVESRHRRADGVYHWFNVLGLPLRDTTGRILHWFNLLIDIDDRKRAEAQLSGEKRLLEMVASGHSLSRVLNELCKFVETTTADCKCGIYFVDSRSRTFQFGLAPSLPVSFNDSVKGLPLTADAGPCGIAALTKSQVIVADVESDPRFQSAAIRPLLLAHGLRSHWSTPIYSRDGQVLATFAIFQSTPSNPTQLQLDLISQVTHIASIGIERALSEEALKRSEMQFKTIFDEAGAGIALVDLKGGAPIQNNRALQKMLGCSEEELGRFETFDRLTHEDNREKDAVTFRELKDGKRDSLRIEKHFVLEDGRSIWANVIFTLLRDDDGLPRYIIAIHEDITERKRALETLQAQQDLLHLAQKAARAMAFDWYIQEEINTWSPEQEALHGLSAGTFDGKYETWKKLVYSPDWPLVLESLKRAQETGEISSEYRVVWPNGSIHWLMAQGQMFFDDLGQPVRIVGFTADVTSRKVIEEELRRSEAFLAQAQQVSRTGSFSWRVATDEITWSDELYRIYELEQGATVTFELIRTRVHPEDLTLYEKMVEHARNGADDFEWHYRLLMPDQSIKYMHAVARATHDRTGQLEYIAAVRDVTARRLADEALDKARSELAHVARVMSLGALTASIAHEVNQPLSGIITNASTCVRMLDADPPNVDGARETARRTIRDGRRAADVITRLRALFTKKEAATELVDLNEATLEVIALSRSELERNGVIMRTDLAEQLPLITGDRVQLQQVIHNLLRNGSDAMSTVDDRPRELLFRTEVEDSNNVRVSIQDSGIGFDLQDLDRLFQSFYTTKRMEWGSACLLAVQSSKATRVVFGPR